jgi:hypothetical protein
MHSQFTDLALSLVMVIECYGLKLLLALVSGWWLKLLPTFAERGCSVVCVTNPYGHILGYLDRSRYYFFQVAPQLYSGEV